MSISSEINRISQNVSDSLTAVASKGATVPSGANSDDLPELIASLPSTHSVTYNLTGGASASVNPSKAIAGQGFSVKLNAPTGYNLNNVTVTMGGVDITSQVFEYDEGGGGVSPSATQHSIYFEFTDSTNTTITGYWDDSFISNAITATTPTTYGQKTVTLAQLDGVTWYEKSAETWQTLYEGTQPLRDDSGYYFWIQDLASVVPTVGSDWRITIDNTSYLCTAKSYISAYIANNVVIGNPLYTGGQDDGSGVPFCFYNYNNEAWSGDTSSSVMTVANHYIKIEKKTT